MRNRLFKTDERISEVYNRIGTICLHILSILIWLDLIYRIVILKQEWREFADIVVVLVFIVIFYIVIISYFIKEAVMSAREERPSGLSIAALVTGILTFSQLFIQLGPFMKRFMPSPPVIIAVMMLAVNFMLFVLPIAALTCGIIDLKGIKAGRYSRKGRGFDIAGIVLVGIFILVALYIAVGEAVLPGS